jgi:hypothetical protein
MTRVGQAMAGAPLIVGTWTYTHPTGATAYERFTSGGEMVLLVEMQASEGTYAVRPDRVDVALPTGSQTFTRMGANAGDDEHRRSGRDLASRSALSAARGSVSLVAVRDGFAHGDVS